MHSPISTGGLNFQKGAGGGLTGSQFLVGVAGKERGVFGKERGVSSFYIKNKWNSEIFNDKRSL